MEHKHLIIRCEAQNPPTNQKIIEEWLVDLVEKIDMKIAAGPISAYVTKKGNEGVTATVLIETSHIVIHVWDKVKPPLIQFDAYSCSNFNIQDVFDHFSVFKPDTIQYKLLDRNEKLIEIERGKVNVTNRIERQLDSKRI